MTLNIKSINPQKMVLNDDSEWQPLPGLEFPSSWKTGDEIIHHKKEGRFSSLLYRVTNNTKNQEAGAIPVSSGDDIRKSLGKSGAAEEEYANLNVDIKIKKAAGDLIWLQDDSKWQMYNPTLHDPGPWENGDVVIVTRRVAKSVSKKYEMKNVATGKELMAIFMGHEK